ncbi:MAG: hypothetical protein M3342_15260 [Bacteroidota bacterium]|nr:hypothetical protein [Flavisolibacter sp.]MBD0284145.1 hypothetical protein [Flavisolibacter sp.]MBD0365347.1 hypothetical protein [Flavisolibacter sp.]MBD0374400.1 hypothetical protein [Flavisolibacter sp.]MDQ3845347.1 hypothetical protein [Bacteroidota bacterium]
MGLNLHLIEEAVESFRNDAFKLYFDILDSYKASIRKATSRLDRENEYRNSRDALLRSLDQIKRRVATQHNNDKMYSNLYTALDTEGRSYIQRFDREANL